MTMMSFSKAAARLGGRSTAVCPVRTNARIALYSTSTIRLSDASVPSSIPFAANPDNFPQPKFWIPRDKREGRSVFVADNTMWFGQSRLKRNDRRCPSRDLNFTAKDWANHKSPYRRWRHFINLIMFKSSTIQRLAFPELASVMAVSACLGLYNELILPAGEMLSISASAL